jgi:hypothetical protein
MMILLKNKMLQKYFTMTAAASVLTGIMETTNTGFLSLLQAIVSEIK